MGIDALEEQFASERLARQALESRLEEMHRDLFDAKRQLEEAQFTAGHDPHPILRFDRRGTLRWFNRAAEQALADRLGESASIESILPAPGVADLRAAIDNDRALQIGVRLDERYYLLTVQGCAKYGYANIYATDITQRELAEARLGQVRREAEVLLSSISVAMIALDTEGRVMRWNAASEEILGRKEVDVLGQPLAACIDWTAGSAERLLEAGARNACTAIDDLFYTDAGGRTIVLRAVVHGRPGDAAGCLILAARHPDEHETAEQGFDPMDAIDEHARSLEASMQQLEEVLGTCQRLVNEYREGHDPIRFVEALERTLAEIQPAAT